MMKSSIYLVMALVALSAAKQLESGPNIQKEPASSSKSPNKRYATQEVLLYLTSDEMKALQAAKSAENKKSYSNNQNEQTLSIEEYNDEQQQKAWLQFFKSLRSEQSREQLQDTYYSKSKPVYENQNENGDAYNFYSEQNVKEQQQRLKSQQEREREESQWIPFNSESAKKQEQSLSQEQVQQHWNIQNNKAQLAQLRGLSVFNSENQKPETSNDNERPVIQWQSISRNQEEQKSEIQKQIESILRDASNAEKQGLASERERYNQQRTPVVIQKEVRITKHQPFPVVEKVNVPVPRPVLVPVPEPYEVKVPHPYPVPLEIVRHIPIPVISNKYA